jgi:molecular chaperone GrpE
LGGVTKDVKDGFIVRDRRFWTQSQDSEQQEASEETAPSPSVPIDVETLRTALAELEDAKHRLRRDSEKQLELQRGRVLEALLPVLDNLDRTMLAGETTHNVDALLAGLKLVQNQFLTTLRDFGLERRSSVGARFDPRLHDAIAVVPVTDASQDGVVLTEAEPAYVVGDRVIRPAKVSVGRAADRPAS